MALQWFLDNPQYSTAILILLSIVIIIVSNTTRLSNWTKMSLMDLGPPKIRVWSLLHILLYMGLGILWPNNHVKFLLVGITFEWFEDCFTENKNTKLVDCNKEAFMGELAKDIQCNETVMAPFLDSEWSDVLINLLGYSLGSALRTQFISPQLYTNGSSMVS